MDDRLRKILVTQRYNKFEKHIFFCLALTGYSRLSELEAKVAFYEGSHGPSAQSDLLLACADQQVNSEAIPQHQYLRSPTTEDHDARADDHIVDNTQTDLTSTAEIYQDEPAPQVQLVTPITPANSGNPRILSETRSSSLEPGLMNPLALGVSTYTPHANRMPGKSREANFVVQLV